MLGGAPEEVSLLVSTRFGSFASQLVALNMFA